MRFAYADPPYIGQARKHYSHDSRCAEVDHEDLIWKLVEEYPNGWALSCSSPSLKEILSYCPDDVRIGGWFKPFASFKKNVTIAYAWEPVIFRGGRKRRTKDPTIRDWVAAPAVDANITLRKGLSGAKPKEFCFWILDVLNVQPGDELRDLYPGTGIMSQCFSEHIGRPIGELFQELIA